MTTHGHYGCKMERLTCKYKKVKAQCLLGTCKNQNFGNSFLCGKHFPEWSHQGSALKESQKNKNKLKIWNMVLKMITQKKFLHKYLSYIPVKLFTTIVC